VIANDCAEGLTILAAIGRALSYAPERRETNEYRRFTERRATPLRDEFPMLRILEGDFSGLIDLWERGPDRKTLCQSQSRLAVG
jgi:hypothetical protein